MLAAVVACSGCAGSSAAPAASLSNDEFWHIVSTFSEPEGEFDLADNLVSNELLFAQIARMLRARGGVYIGVGPEQNFSYIARIAPSMAFIIDIRQDNRNLHLMYKALFELAANRHDFVSRLFSREQTTDRSLASSVTALFSGVDALPASIRLLDETKTLVRRHLVETRQLPLSVEDLQSIDDVLQVFATDGSSIRYGRRMPPSKSRPSYRMLMTRTDLRGHPQSYLSSDEAFSSVKTLHERNAIVPLVGDFAGPHTLKRVAEFVRERGRVVSSFYASNVEVYLTRDQKRIFCRSLATLPYGDDTTFINSRQLQPFGTKLEACKRIQPSLYWPP